MPTETRIHPFFLKPLLVLGLYIIVFQTFDLWDDYSSGEADLYQKHGGITIVQKTQDSAGYNDLMRYQTVRLGLTVSLFLILYRLHRWANEPATPFG